MFAHPVNKPVIITGCQRSGTTLLSLILDSHPQMTSVDEMEFDAGKLKEYLEHSDYHPSVVFKLPTEAASFRVSKTLPHLKVLWCMRDPRDVVASMLKLNMELINGQAIAWPNSWLGGMKEIAGCLPFIDLQRPLVGLQEYQRVASTPDYLRTRKDAVSMGALCWEFKNALLAEYARENIRFKVVNYENLIRHPRLELEKVLSFLDMPWHDNVLRHHELHEGTYVGNTIGNRPIDPLNSGKWKHELSSEEVATIESLCSRGMSKFGYGMEHAERIIAFGKC